MRYSLAVTVLMVFAAAGQLPASDEISGELVGLQVSLAAEKQLVVHDQLVTAGEWVAALDLLDRLNVDSGNVLIKVAPSRFVGLPVAIQQRLCRLPSPGLEFYRRRSDPPALIRLHRAQFNRDDDDLWKIVEEASASVAAPAAIHHLASQAATRGDLELALRLWSRLIEMPDRNQRVFPSPLTKLLVREPEPAQRALQKALAVRQTLGVPLAEHEIQSATEANSQSGKLAELPLLEVLGPPRTHGASAALGAIRWTTVAAASCPLAESQTPLSVTASRAGLLLINNGQQVRAIHSDTGEPYWPSDQPLDVGEVYREVLVNDDLTRELACRIAGGQCSSDRYFGVLGEAPRWRPRPGLVPLSGSLVALDTTQGQGRMLWRVETRHLPEPDWLFHGQPVLSPGAWPGENLVVVPLCRAAPQVELAIAAFSQDAGQLVWWTRIGICGAEPGRPLAQTQLLSRAGLVVARTLTGVVLALSARSGQIQWASTALVASPPVQVESPAPLLDARAGVLAVADPVLSQVSGLSLDSGEVLWQHEVPFPIQGVVCAPGGRVLIAGTRLRAVSLMNGIPLWEHGFDDLATAGTGVPQVSGWTAVWPTRNAVWGLDLDQGGIEFQRMLSNGPVAVPIQLVQNDSHWILCLPDAILSLKKNLP